MPEGTMLGAAVAVPLVLFCLAAWESHDTVIAAATLRVEQTARILEEHALKVLETNELVVEAVRGRLGAEGAQSPQGAQGAGGDAAGERDIHDFLVRLQSKVPQIGTITVADAQGHMRASNRTYPPNRAISFADRDWFRDLAAPGGAGMVVSSAYPGRQSRIPIFNIAVRAPPLPDGGFGGAIAISIDRSYFETFYAAVETTYDFSVLLVRDDGEILASVPPTAVTRLDEASHLVTAMRQAPVGTYRNRSRLDHVDRIFSYRKVPGYPVAVRFGISRQAALAPWRATVLAYGITALLTMLCLLATALLALRQTRRWRATADALSAEVAERESIEGQLRQAQKMEALGQLTGGIAHDFNNMLSVVIGAVDLARRRLARGEMDIVRHLETASDGAARAAALTQRLLAFARQQPLHPEPVSVNALVTGLAELLRRTIGSAVRLEIALDPAAFPVRIDSSELENVLLNLAVNARDAMPDGGVLRIATGNVRCDEDGADGDYLALDVSDTGTGMTAAVAARIFEPFFTTKPAGKGTGLGLSQCYGFARQCGGSIRVETELGRGTVFRLRLPRLVASAARQAAHPAAAE